jgi:thioredoxin 1
MPVITLNPSNRSQVHTLLTDDLWSVVCLCAAWCDVCTRFRSHFETLASVHPDKIFLWIDIEDEAEIVGDLDIDNFPTLLIALGEQVTFYGTIEADTAVVKRLITAKTRINNMISNSTPGASAVGCEVDDGSTKKSTTKAIRSRLAAVI